ncbi:MULTISPECIES: hypothetical protein [unclassified Coleofasciculus]|uniref:hypothetical protein n=1 Tax=unclassified Coleofasciculus TaxID=2692782 RepID=UPI001882847D|nr:MULTISPECIES: hypothetical protein [unclassified Coleofasciculus]MBE9129696.1 hypothetical protein [Coleofasciculus sp. LEGE 07081]MBE9149545.1 hypothetical protein [Coleofasciculus sp. LEGE 07092]
MTNPSLPERHEELMAGYVLGDLDVEEAAEFERLLAYNSELATEVGRLDRQYMQLIKL